ncbi:hypothetical protein [Phaffia rhodozyma]|uniref:Uncharacterized protein n=1 Tax=Phaffia rhodozyma TaxID=264483 RepID=A0A0F7SV54_PHARH|nr:hypothetical protein [Phaffia rhodozyma]
MFAPGRFSFVPQRASEPPEPNPSSHILGGVCDLHPLALFDKVVRVSVGRIL